MTDLLYHAKGFKPLGAWSRSHRAATPTHVQTYSQRARRRISQYLREFPTAHAEEAIEALELRPRR